jgi:cell division protein FtsL
MSAGEGIGSPETTDVGRAAERRVARRPASATAPLALRVARAPLARAARARAGGVLDSLLHGRGWIAIIAVLLTGVVFFNVDLLQRGREIARTSERAAQVKRENARLRLELARLVSSERIQRAAAGRGLFLPAPGQVRYLKADPARDGRRAAKRVGEPAPDAPAPAASAPAPATGAPAPAATAPTPAPSTPAPTTTAPQQTGPPQAPATVGVTGSPAG